MKLIKNNLLIICGMFVFIFYSCIDPVDEANFKVDEQWQFFLVPEVGLINSTIDFVMYANPKNYWYDNNRTTSATVSKRLQALIDQADEFIYNDYEMMHAKQNMVETVRKMYKEEFSNDHPLYNLLANEMDKLRFFFGNTDGVKVPNNLSHAITTMDSVIRTRYFQTLPERIFQLETDAIGTNKITIDQFKEIRTHTLQAVKDSLNDYVSASNDEWASELVNNIMEAYSNQYPVNSAYEYLCNYRKYVGTLLRFMQIENNISCNYENIKEDDCNWGYLFWSSDDKIIYHYSCLGDGNEKYNIGKVILKEGKYFCVFAKDYVYPSLCGENVEGEIDTQIAKQLSNQGNLTKSKKSKIELLLEEGCIQFPLMFNDYNELENGNREEITYVAKIASREEYERFVEDIRSIEALNKLFK